MSRSPYKNLKKGEKRIPLYIRKTNKRFTAIYGSFLQSGMDIVQVSRSVWPLA